MQMQGDYDSQRFMHGGQIMVSTPSYLPRARLQLDNVELTQTGQAFRLGRYSIHWHMQGDVAFQSWVRGCAIHHTYNRALTMHGVHRAVVQGNVAFNVMGHAFFMEVRAPMPPLWQGLGHARGHGASCMAVAAACTASCVCVSGWLMCRRSRGCLILPGLPVADMGGWLACRTASRQAT